MRIPTNNLVLMVSSALLSLLLWLWVGAEERSEVVVNVPLEYRNLPRGYEISSREDLVSKVNIWVKGSTALIRNLRPQEVTAWIDLSNTRPGERLFELSPQDVRVPYGFSVLRISPSQISLNVEETARRTVEVLPRLKGEPPVGYSVQETIVTPSNVEIVGPRSAVNSIQHVTTDSIDISELSGDYTERVKIGTENTQVRLGSVKEVTVELKISEIEDIFTLRQIPVVPGDTGRVLSFNPKVVRIEVQAPKRLLSELTQSKVKAVLDLEGLKPGVYELTPRIVFETKEKGIISVKSIMPARIHIRIR
jgi:YbbR domain-containing protein